MTLRLFVANPTDVHRAQSDYETYNKRRLGDEDPHSELDPDGKNTSSPRAASGEPLECPTQKESRRRGRMTEMTVLYGRSTAPFSGQNPWPATMSIAL